MALLAVALGLSKEDSEKTQETAGSNAALVTALMPKVASRHASRALVRARSTTVAICARNSSKQEKPTQDSKQAPEQAPLERL